MHMHVLIPEIIAFMHCQMLQSQVRDFFGFFEQRHEKEMHFGLTRSNNSREMDTKMFVIWIIGRLAANIRCTSIEPGLFASVSDIKSM